MGHELPREILIEIFSWLPAKSIGKCRCLAKEWQTLLSSPEFIKSHLSRRPNQETLILINTSSSINSVSKMGHRNVFKMLDLGGGWVEISGSCDGLVLLVNEDEELFLVNPASLKQAKIQDSPLALDKDESFRIHGLGYDSHSDDYKIVTLSYYDIDSEDEPDCDDTFVDVYSGKTGVWKRVDNSPYDHGAGNLSPGAFMNGVIHWLARSGDSGCPLVIATFDLAREVLNEMPPPNDIDMSTFTYNKLVVLEGCLCIVNNRYNNLTDVWIMKEYMVDSWVKFSIDVDYARWYLMKPLCFTCDKDDGNVVFVTAGEALAVYNHQEGTLRDMVVDGVRAVAVDGGTFVRKPCLAYFWSC